MPEGIDDTVSIHLIDTRLLVEEAKKIREAQKLADEADGVKKRLAEGRAPFISPETDEDVLPRGFEQKITDDKLLSGLGPLVEKKVEEILDQKIRTRPLTSSSSPIISPDDREALPKGFFQGTPQTREGAISGARTDNAFREQQRKQKALEDEIKKLKKQQHDLETKLIGNIQTVGNAISNPIGTVFGSLMQKLGKFGVIGAVIAGSAGVIYEEILKQFERGGVFSTRLKFPQQALTLNNIEDDNAYRSGTKYITDDLRVVQKAPNNSNTANLKFEMVRYTVENAGR